MTPLQRFRAYMVRMNPAADPALAVRDGLYEPPSGAVHVDLARRLELEPASTHLLLGGTGSGKTTELLQTRDRLQESLAPAGDHVEYIDVSRRHDLEAPTLEGVLVALAGLALVERAFKAHRHAEPPSEVLRAMLQINRHAHRHLESVEALMDLHRGEGSEEEDDPDLIEVGGALVPPDAPIPDDLARLIPAMGTLMRAAHADGHAVFLFDSLDRLPTPERFREAVEHDLRVLKAAGIGSVVVGPIRFMVGRDRAIAELFDATHFQRAADPDASGLAFLTAVLRRRASADMLPDECLAPIARASGGILRDLISLAKSAGSEAYAAGQNAIGRQDVERAIHALGRDLAVGLDDEQVRLLKNLQRGRDFVIRGERELLLLETRRVVLFGGSRWAVHPALAPLLDAVPEAA